MPIAFTHALLIALGGALGALARWAAGRWAYQLGGTGFPYGTLAVNLAGAFLLGVLVRWRPPGDAWLYFAGVGFAGGFTTFSALAVEVIGLWDREPLRAAAYLLLTLLLGLALAALGLWVGKGLRNF